MRDDGCGTVVSVGACCFYGTKIVPSYGGRHRDSSGAEVEPLSRGGRRVSSYFPPPCVQDSVSCLFGKPIHVKIHFVSNQRHSLYFLMVRIRCFPFVS